MNIKEIQNILNVFCNTHSYFFPSKEALSNLMSRIGMAHELHEGHSYGNVVAMIQIHISKLILDDYITNVKDCNDDKRSSRKQQN